MTAMQTMNQARWKSVLATCAAVVLGCCLGYAAWHFAIWEVYYSKSSPKSVPFERFGEVTRAVAIGLGGVLGLIGKEVALKFLLTPREGTNDPPKNTDDKNP